MQPDFNCRLSAGIIKDYPVILPGKPTRHSSIVRSPQENVWEMIKRPQENVDETTKSPQENVDKIAKRGNLQAKSLKAFCKKFRCSSAIRASMASWCVQDMPIDAEGASCKLINLPLYAVSQIMKLDR